MRPIINSVQDKATRDALSKTLIEQVKGTSSVDAIAKAAQDAPPLPLSHPVRAGMSSCVRLPRPLTTTAIPT